MEYQGILTAKGVRIGIVISRFNSHITGHLLEGAMDCLTRHQADEKLIDKMYCPGAFELPLAAQILARSKKYDAIICLGCVVRGETPHFDYIAAEVSKGLAQTALTHNIPVGFGVLTTDTMEQAVDRAGGKAGNKGWDAAMTVIEMANVQKQIGAK